MPQIVESNAGQGGLADQPDPLMCQRSGLDRAAVDLCNDEAVTVRPKAKPQLFLCLPGTVRLQLGKDGRGQRYRAGSAGLGSL